MNNAVEASGFRLTELVAAISPATDLGTGQPLEHALRTCRLSMAVADSPSPSPEPRYAVCMQEQRPIAYWLKLVDSLITEQFAASLEEHGVTRLQWQLLNLLNHGPATGADLGAMLAPFLSSATGADEPTDPGEHLSELVESGWVSLELETYDLTERGTTSLTRLTDVVESIRAKVSAGIAVEDYDTTVRTLQRMAGNLGWRGDD